MSPNNSYLRSRKKEQELVREFRANGFISARSAGSKSEIDVWAFNPKTKEMFLIQIKTTLGCSKYRETDLETFKDVTVHKVTRRYDA
jgi:Holliday junction resolvase